MLPNTGMRYPMMFSLSLVILGLAPRTVCADEPSRAASAAQVGESAPRGHLYGGIGFFGTVAPRVGIALDALGAGRIGPIAVGANVQLGTEIFGQDHIALAPVVGYYLPTKGRFEAGIFATAGVHFYSSVGHTGFLSHDPGFDATLPFAGMRGVFGWRLGKRPITLGFHGFFNVDLARVTRTYDYEEIPILFGNGQTETVTVTHTAGTIRGGVLFAVGTPL